MKMVTQHSEKLAKPFVFFISNFFMPDSFSPNVVGGKRKMCATVFSSRNSFLLPSPHTTGVLLPTFSSSSSPSYSSSYSSHTSHTSSHVLITCVCQEQICYFFCQFYEECYIFQHRVAISALGINRYEEKTSRECVRFLDQINTPKWPKWREMT